MGLLTNAFGFGAVLLCGWLGLAGAARASAEEDAESSRRRGRNREEKVERASKRDAEGSDAAKKANAKTKKSETQDAEEEPPRRREGKKSDEKDSDGSSEESDEKKRTRRSKDGDGEGEAPATSNTAEPPIGETKKKKRLPPHEGFIFAPRFGLHHCVGKICSAERHRATAGPRVDLFLGRNIGGIFDVGINAGWGMFFAPHPTKTNALTLYGVDLDRYDAFARLAGPLFRFDARELKVQYARLATARVGAHFRVHFNPRGRFVGYVGVGIGYSLFRGKYLTPPGIVRVDFHGFDIPIDAGAAFHVHKRVALGVEGSYVWANYLVATITHPAQKAVAPLSLLQASIMRQDTQLKQDLPKVWSVGFVVRIRL